MIRYALFVAVLIGAAILQAPAAEAAGVDELKATVEAIKAKDWRSAEQHADEAVDSKDLNAAQHGFAYYARGTARWAQIKEESESKLVAARDDFSAAIEALPKGHSLWFDALRSRYFIQLGLNRWREAADDFATLANASPAAAKIVPLRSLFRLAYSLRDDEPTLAALLSTIHTTGYQPRGPGETLDSLTSQYIRILVQKGQVDDALGYLSKMTDTNALIETRIDRRFASLWTQAQFNEATKPTEIAKRELSRWETRFQIYPTVTKVIIQYVRTLRQANESDKAIAVARKALSDPKALASDPFDGDELWLRNELVYALKDAGKIDEAAAEMAPILAIDPAENPNVVSQLINFGQILIEVGRTTEGVDMAKRAWSKSSPLGKMFIQGIEVCADAESDRAAAEKTLAEMRKTDNANYAAVSQALLCLGQTDEVAALVKRRLAEPGSRSAMLGAAQTYNQAHFVTPLRKILIERYQTIFARPDVRQEIEKYGRIEAFPFIPSYWGTL